MDHSHNNLQRRQLHRKLIRSEPLEDEYSIRKPLRISWLSIPLAITVAWLFFLNGYIGGLEDRIEHLESRPTPESPK